MTHFNKAALEIPGLDSGLKTYSFVEGFRPDQLFTSLMKKPAETFDDLLSRVQKYIHMEKPMVAKTSDAAFKK